MQRKSRKRWFSKLNLEVPAPLAAIVLLLFVVASIALVAVDWSTMHLPPQGAPGRFDWAVAQYYPAWRRERERQKQEWRRQNPNASPYLPLPKEALEPGTLGAKPE